jgi:hypothetical protein
MVTKANADQMKATSKDPFVRRLLGAEGGFGKLLGLDDEWALRAIKVSGNARLGMIVAAVGQFPGLPVEPLTAASLPPTH